MSFPSNPTLGTKYTLGNTTWTFDGNKWTKHSELPYSALTSIPTTLAGHGITDAVSTNGNIVLLPNGITLTSLASSHPTATAVTFDSFQISTFDSVIYDILAQSDGQRQFQTLRLIHDGVTVQLIEYATLFTTASLGTFSANIVDSNIIITFNLSTSMQVSFRALRTGFPTT